MGGTNILSLISAHYHISAYFLTAQTYKRIRLTTQVYSKYKSVISMHRLTCLQGYLMEVQRVPNMAVVS